MADDGLDTVASVLPIWAGLASFSTFAGDVHLGEGRVLTATVAAVSQQMLQHLAGMQEDTIEGRVDGVTIVGITR